MKVEFVCPAAEDSAFLKSRSVAILADLRKGEESREVLRFVEFWRKHHGGRPKHLVFDSKLTTYAVLSELNRMCITFITLRRRSPSLMREMVELPRSAWRVVD